MSRAPLSLNRAGTTPSVTLRRHGYCLAAKKQQVRAHSWAWVTPIFKPGGLAYGTDDINLPVAHPGYGAGGMRADLAEHVVILIISSYCIQRQVHSLFHPATFTA